MKALLLAVSCLTIALIIYYFKPSSGFSDLDDPVTVEQTEKAVVSTDDAAVVKKTGNNTLAKLETTDEEYETRVQKYKVLEKSRRNLDRSLSRLKAFLWKVKLPREEAEEINSELISAYGLLTNKKLMGAFSSLEAMEDEIKKVNYSHNKTKEFIERIKNLPGKN